MGQYIVEATNNRDKQMNKSKAADFAKKLAFPRMVGTVGELRARDWIEQQLRGFGYAPQRRDFRFYPYLAFQALKDGLWLIAALLVVQRLLSPLYPAATAWLGLAIWPLALYLNRLWKRYARDKFVDHSDRFRVWKRFRPEIGIGIASSNVEVTLHRPPQPTATVYLMAHYDSKSQNISIVTRIVAAILSLVGIAMLPALHLVGYLAPSLGHATVFLVVYRVLFWLTLVALVMLALLRVENSSPGALDNAPSCGILLEIAQDFVENKQELPQHLEIHAVFTGAEEIGLAGAEALLWDNRESWQNREVYVLNIDGAGVSQRHSVTAATGLRSASGKSSVDMIDAVSTAAQTLSLPLRVVTGIIGGEADHIPFNQAGIPAVSLQSYGLAATAIHTARDTIDRLDETGLAQSTALVKETLRILDNRVAKGGGDGA